MFGFVLLVDDDPAVLNLNAAVVRHFGFKVMATHSVDEAIELIETIDVSMIISDVEMPGETGFDFARRLGEKNLKTMPLMYMTGYNTLDLLKTGLEVGGDDFLLKGSPAAKLRERIAFWMASGFSGLPSELRRRALVKLDQIKGHHGGVEKLLEFNSDLGVPILEQLKEELKTFTDLDSVRYCDRISFLGRLSKLIVDECNGVGDYIRFPDYCYLISSRLDLPFFDTMRVIFRSFEDWTTDERFLAGAQFPLGDIDMSVFAE